MSLKALRTLVAIAQYGSFARAAEAVCLTQSAVSLHVRSLEEDFKVSLFDRSRRIPVLTEAGHRAVEQARDILAQYDGIAAELGEGGELAGRLRIGAIQTALAGVLPAALAALRRAHPRLRVLVNSGMSAELAIRIDAGELDAAVTTEPVKPYPTGLVSTPLYQEGFWIVAPLALASLDARQLLQDRPFIRFDRRAWAGRTIDRELRRQRLRVQTDMELDSQDAIIQMVASGLGVAVIPLSEREKNRLDNLVCIPFGEPQQQRRVVLLEREDRPAARLAAALAEAIRTQSGDDVIHEK
ncbi:MULTISPECIES: LysR family transcriptional regulator [Pectobacterium]|uniref:LysR family transcriptional regulator n=1 Tax=Pectobacterium odoriferum TaxID=78398 RepID=A0ABR4VKD9_9GAMM|nr:MULTISPECIES: LysR family transcriptional regulator [Pectobacterium]KGA39829.1 LysR family transcriptional regulator [Pectobacterium odoriferum]MBD0848544.1 LysR family transcriptional regulator [Pectobacterium carotovorum subsp. carotovorum]MBK4824799.1 HTH-type transcriptional regulator MetR [Pectobacterium carotovorum subsp. carotovorum]MCA6960404.1 LysR family transcriptional regulator [Pectobacterium odoriferum]MCH5008522.1 LysR family transcriptional regulator [Pectobacterium odorifer